MSLLIREEAPPGMTVSIQVDEVLFRGRTRFHNEVLIGRTPCFGKAVFMDGNAQGFESDEAVYHTALVQPAMFSHPSPKRVFIAGGGEGATLREVLRHPEVARATMVDIDEEAVSAFREHLPEWHQGAFEDPRAVILYEDALAFLERGEPDRYDVMVVDLGDPIQGGPSKLAYAVEFFRDLEHALAPDGILAIQAGAFDHHRLDNLRAIRTTMAAVFPHVRAYKCSVPSFCSDWGFVMASKAPLPDAPPDLETRLARGGPDVWQHYDATGHASTLWLSPRLRQAVQEPGRTLRRDRPILTGGPA
jgi:spermidine synthase